MAGVSLFTTTDRFGGDLDIMEQGHNLTPDSDGDDTNHGGFVPRPINERLFFYADVFQSDRDGDADVYIDDDPTIDLVGAENLTGDAPGFDGLPAVSPSGRRIAFTSDRSGGDRDVFAMGTDGSAPVNLTSDSAASDEAPAWETIYRCNGRRVTILGAFGTVFADLHPQGTPGDDVFYGFTFNAGAGDDLACGSRHGGDGSKISGGKGNDRIFGSQNRDTLTGRHGRRPTLRRARQRHPLRRPRSRRPRGRRRPRRLHRRPRQRQS